MSKLNNFKNFIELYKLDQQCDRGLELLGQAKEILASGVSTEMKDIIKSEGIYWLNVDSFTILHSAGAITIEYSGSEEGEKTFDLELFKDWLEENNSEFLRQYRVISDVDDQGEGVYHDFKAVSWFDALENVRKYTVEIFINEKYNPFTK